MFIFSQAVKIGVDNLLGSVVNPVMLGAEFLGIVGNNTVIKPGIGSGQFIKKSVGTVVADGGVDYC